MIRINLLPQHLRPIRRTPLPYIACIALFAVVVMAMASTWVATQAQVMAARQSLESHKADLAELQDIVAESNDLEASKRQLADKIITIEAIVKDRIIWSRELWLLSKLTPSNFWYSEVFVTSKAYPTQEPVMDPKTGKPKVNPQTNRIEMKTTNVNRPILRLSGYVIDSSDGRQDVSPLTDALTTDPEFSKMFQLEQPSFSTTEFKGYPVKKFTLEFLITAEGSNNDGNL